MRVNLDIICLLIFIFSIKFSIVEDENLTSLDLKNKGYRCIFYYVYFYEWYQDVDLLEKKPNNKKP